MKQKLLNSIRLRIALLVALLCSLGTGSVWGESTVTWTINGVNTTASGGTNVNTTLRTSAISPNTETGVWTAVASTSYAGSSNGAQLGSSSYTFAGTVSLSGSAIPALAVIKSIGITLSSSGTAYKIDAKVGSTTFGSQVSVNQKDEKTYSFTGSVVGNTITLTFSSGGKKNVIIKSITVTYADPLCDTPTFSPAGGEVTKGSEITISCETDGATIYYTTDGSTPTTSSAEYDPESKPTIVDDVTIKAIAVKSGRSNSNVGSASYTIAKADNAITFTGDITSTDIALTGVGAVSSFDIGAITSATYGTPTYAVKSATNLTEETEFSLNTSTGVISFTSTYKGIIVVTASVAATDTYKGATKDLTINCSGDLRTPQFTFDATEAVGIGSTITVAAGDNVETDGDITLASDDTDIATVNNETGVITGEAAGSCTITVTTAAGTYYSASSTTFTLNVIDYAILPFIWEGGTSSELTALTGVSADGLGSDYAAGNAPYRLKMDTANDYILVKTNAKPGRVYFDVKMLGGSSTSKIKVQESADGSSFTDVQEFTISGAQNDIHNFATTNDFKDASRYVRIIKSVHASGGNIGVGPITITGCESATIGSTGWTTFASAYPLDLSSITASTGTVTAYYASSIVGDSYVRMTSTTSTVAAGEGLMLKGTAGATITIPVAASGEAISGNLLKGCTTSTALSISESKYVLVNNGGTAEFQSLAEHGATIPAGKAYLDASIAGVKALRIVFEDTETGIQTIDNGQLTMDSDAVIFNLAGQRVNKAQKGLYILNGRKVLVK